MSLIMEIIVFVVTDQEVVANKDTLGVDLQHLDHWSNWGVSIMTTGVLGSFIPNQVLGHPMGLLTPLRCSITLEV